MQLSKRRVVAVAAVALLAVGGGAAWLALDSDTEEPEPGIISIDSSPLDRQRRLTTEEWGIRLGCAAAQDPAAFDENGQLSPDLQRQYDGLAAPAPEDKDNPDVVLRERAAFERGFQRGLAAARTAGAESPLCKIGITGSTPQPQVDGPTEVKRISPLGTQFRLR